jgi:hypothetical protein
VKRLVFEERRHLVEFSDNGFDIMPGEGKVVKLGGEWIESLEQLTWRWIGREVQSILETPLWAEGRHVNAKTQARIVIKSMNYGTHQEMTSSGQPVIPCEFLPNWDINSSVESLLTIH